MSQDTVINPPEKVKTISYEQAREIMAGDAVDDNWLCEQIAARHNGKLFEDNSKRFNEIPLSETELEKYRGTFILIPGYGLSIEDFFSIESMDIGLVLEDSWYVNYPFAKNERVERCWYLVRKGIIPGSAGETYPQWEKRLEQDEEIPRACELFFTAFFYFIFTEGNRLYRRAYPICRDIVSETFHPHVGFFQGKLGVRYYSRLTPDPCIGLVPIRKLFVPSVLSSPCP